MLQPSTEDRKEHWRYILNKLSFSILLITKDKTLASIATNSMGKNTVVY